MGKVYIEYIPYSYFLSGRAPPISLLAKRPPPAECPPKKNPLNSRSGPPPGSPVQMRPALSLFGTYWLRIRTLRLRGGQYKALRRP